MRKGIIRPELKKPFPSLEQLWISTVCKIRVFTQSEQRSNAIIGAKVIADHNFEALDEPFWRDWNTLFGNGGIIERLFDGSMKEKYLKLGPFVSISAVPDTTERFCLHLLQNVQDIYDKYVVGVRSI
jgi:hypothetical protein